MRLLRLSAAFSLAGFTAACGGPRVSDIIQNAVSLSVIATASQPDVAALGDGEGGLAVTRAFVSVSSVALVPCNEEAAPIMLDPRGYDLLGMPPPSELVSTSVTKLCGLRFDIAPLTSNALPGVPDETSLYVEGKDALGADFSLQSDDSISLSFAAAAGESFGRTPLLLAFDVSTWLAGLPVPSDTDARADPFVTQLGDSAGLFVDRDGDQALDDDEQTPIARAAASR